ncbi:ABC-F family ATP-binding cassette domain-containing protein [bacterium]|nr:ABC-F family ATP-binding cassette domain-containing protein [bacterium]
MLHLVNLTVDFGGRALFENLNWHIRHKDRVALIGANGVGKSTLMKIICREFTPTSGEVVHSKELTVGYLPQDGLHAHGKPLLAETMTAFAEIMSVHDRMKVIEHQLASLDHESEEYMELIHRYGDLQHRLESLDGFSIEAKAARILTGLGFKETDFEKPCENFSGGWQMRIALAKLLLQNPDLLLLDEPTNHLDIESIEWFENYLKNYEGSVLLISHDRYFINAVCDRITELERRQLIDYFGDYEQYEDEKILSEERLLAAYERQQDELKRVQVFIDRFRYKASKARQVQSRVKMLDRMDKIQLPEEERKAVNFRFPQPVKSGRVVLEMEDVHKSYGNKEVLRNVSFTLERGEKVALIGVNGAGKSTLVKMIAGAEPVSRGEINLGYNVSLEYFAQQQAEKLNIQNTVYEEITSASVSHTPVILRTILGAFLFSGDDVNKKVNVLSGGERSRLAFAKMLLNPANFIILDEPTNHIDAQTKDILQGALADYEGTLLIVSHDRYFLDNLVNKVIEVKNGATKIYLGNYSDYHAKKEKELAELAASQSIVKTSEKNSSKEQRQVEKGERKKASTEQRRTEKKLSEIEQKIQKQEEFKRTLETQLADPELYKNPDKAKQIQFDYQKTGDQIAKLYEEWEMLAGKIESPEA